MKIPALKSKHIGVLDSEYSVVIEAQAISKNAVINNTDNAQAFKNWYGN
ncbi:MAG: hypothetical protein ACI4RC_01825 [Oscillospiraceae bacterium]